ncbi:MAG: SDR family oxidoreductase [Flavobacteriales bacterium]|nr:SDR family oxidoreductase [Flavobacteriales bacterium]
MKIAITGGAGYIGAELVAALSTDERITELVVYDDLSRGHHGLFMGPRMGRVPVRFVQGDILDSRKLRKELAGMDRVFHLAAKVTTPFADAGHHHFEQVNHWGTAEMVYAIEDVAPDACVVYLSSTAVYGSGEAAANSGVRPAPRSAYGHSKWRGETHMERLMDDRSVTILRLGNVYGAGRSVRFDAVINRFLFEAHHKGRISISGSGLQQRPFIHIDGVIGTLGALVHGTPLSGIFDLVDHDLSVLDLVEALRTLYPKLEFLFVDQHLELLSLKVPRDARLQGIQPERKADLVQELEAMQGRFAW